MAALIGGCGGGGEAAAPPAPPAASQPAPTAPAPAPPQPPSGDGAASAPVAVPVRWTLPTGRRVALDACDPAGPRAASVRWRFGDGRTADGDAASCRIDHAYPREGRYAVAVETRDGGGRVVARGRAAVVVQNWLVVSIGDSYGAGEGAPTRPASGPPGGIRSDDERCQRSDESAHARIAAALDAHDDQTSVTFVDLACLGARVGRGGLLRAYRDRMSGSPGRRIPSQIGRVAALAAGAEIDAVLLTAGGNDLGFIDAVARCAFGASPCWRGLGRVGCAPTAAADCQPPTARRLSSSFCRLARVLSASCAGAPAGIRGRRLVAPGRVHLLEYPSLLRDDDGSVCAGPLPGIDGGEAAWADTRVLRPVDRLLARTARRTGWRIEGGIYAASIPHGVCASEPWVNGLGLGILAQVLGGQGTLRERLLGVRDELGRVLHPNPAGYAATAALVAPRLIAELYPGGVARRPRPPQPPAP